MVDPESIWSEGDWNGSRGCDSGDPWFSEQVTDDAELEPVAGLLADKYPTGPWDFVARDGAFSDRNAGGRVICSGYAWCEAWGSARVITSARRPGRASDEPGRRSDAHGRQHHFDATTVPMIRL